MTGASELETGDDESLAAELDELALLEIAVAREAQRYRILFESAPVAFITTDTAAKIQEANTTASDYFQVDNRFLVGKLLPTFVATGERRRFRTWMLDLCRRGASGSLTVRLQRRSGVPFDAHIRAMTSEEEIWWAIVDVTAQRQAEESVWELNREIDSRVASEVRELQALYDELPIGIAIVEAATGRVHGKNQRAREILRPWGGELPGLERSDLDGRPAALARSLLDRALTGERVPREVNHVPTPDGDDLVLEFSATPLHNDRGTIAAVALTFDDLSERERRDRADAQFVENAAHQLRTPITAIAVATAALQAGAKDDPDERERFIGHVSRESDRMARLVDALLALARLQRGGARPLVALVPVAPLVNESVEAIQLRRGVELVVDVPPEVAFLGDGPMLREAIANVLQNAVAHTDAGSIRISARLVDDRAIVEIADTGPGIPADVGERVFERFFQVGRGTRRGAGLGLAVASEAAQANGGTLELIDTPLGATFRFTLPGAKRL